MVTSPVQEEVHCPDGRVTLGQQRRDLRLADIYRRGGAYWYNGGWNWRAMVAPGVGALLAVGGAWSAPGQGPFPEGGLIPALKPLYKLQLGGGFRGGTGSLLGADGGLGAAAAGRARIAGRAAGRPR